MDDQLTLVFRAHHTELQHVGDGVYEVHVTIEMKTGISWKVVHSRTIQVHGPLPKDFDGPIE